MTQYAGQNFAVHTAQTETSSVGDTARIHQTPSPRQKVSLQLLLMILGIATISINDARIAGYPISDYFMVASLALVCLTILSGKRRLLAAGEMRKAPPIFVVGAIVFISGATLSTFSSADPGTSVALIGRIAWVALGVFWVLRLLTRNRSAIRYFVTAYRATTLISSTVAILGSVGVLATDTIGNERQMAFFGHPNSLATCREQQLAIGVEMIRLVR